MMKEKKKTRCADTKDHKPLVWYSFSLSPTENKLARLQQKYKQKRMAQYDHR